MQNAAETQAGNEATLWAGTGTQMKTGRLGDGDEQAMKKLERAAASCLRNLKPRDGSNRATVHARLQELGGWMEPGATMHVFGSTACDLHAHGADLDLTMLPGPRPRWQQQALVRHLAEAFQPLQESGEFTLVEAIDRARVPILKLHHAESGLSCDISIGNDLGLRKTRLLHAYVLCDGVCGPAQSMKAGEVTTGRVRSLCLIVKSCADRRLKPQPHSQHHPCTSTTSPCPTPSKHHCVPHSGARRRDQLFRVTRDAGGITFHGAFNSYAWVRCLYRMYSPPPRGPYLLPLIRTLALG